jgi:hypothetical protein
MRESEQTDLLPLSTPGEKALDAAAIVIGVAPWLGGPLAAVLTGMSAARKIRRIRDVLVRVSIDVKELRTDVQKTYLRSEDFEDLLEQTLRVAADERCHEKRESYGAFLAGAIDSPGEPYDDQIRILRTLEQLQPDHMRLIRALAQAPDLTNAGYTGSPIQTLSERLPGMPEPQIDDLVQMLNDLRITNTGELRLMMTWDGAQDLRSRITPFGKRFLAFLRQS